MKKYHLILLSLLSGLLLSLSWPARGFPGLLFIALIPLLWIEDYILNHPGRFIRFSIFFYSYPAFLLWNLLTTWWIYNSTGFGSVIAISVNALFMAIVFSLFHYTRKHLKSRLNGYLALIVYWMAFEYLHLNWDLNWPWLNLGNGFASYYKWVQWYEYTGTFGGTLWVLVSNILGYTFLSRSPFFGVSRSWLSWFYLWLVVILTPLLVSFYIYNSYKEKINPVSCVVVQPNLDPYNEQYVLPPSEVVDRIMSLASPHIDSMTSFLVAPESAIQESMWENDLGTFASIRFLQKFLVSYPDLNILVGGSTFYEFRPGDRITRTARKFKNQEEYYDAYNAAIMLNRTDSIQLYHKSRLTPGVEILPSFKGFKWLEKFALNLGGTVGSLGTDSVRTVYRTTNTVPVSAVICYESVFGEFFAEFVRNGAQLMFIITNDGWWGNSGGYRQHYAFAHIRAIETRRSIARSANTGISAFIDQCGDAHQQTGYWVKACIKGNLNANTTITFYVEHGDYFARIALVLGAFLFLSSLYSDFISRRHLRSTLKK